jgi:hypothetical protein
MRANIKLWVSSKSISPDVLNVRRYMAVSDRPLYLQGKRPGTYFVGDLLDLRTDLDEVEKKEIFFPAGTGTKAFSSCSS